MGAAIPVGQDVHGANPASLGGLAAELPGVFAPATAAAVLQILRHERIPLSGRRAVVVGRSTVGASPPRCSCWPSTPRPPSPTPDGGSPGRLPGGGHPRRRGRPPKLIGADHVRPGAVVIDVGTTPTESTGRAGRRLAGLAGDVDAAAVTGIASVLTPVPGGVGPVTTAVLMQHTLGAAARAAAQD